MSSNLPKLSLNSQLAQQLNYSWHCVKCTLRNLWKLTDFLLNEPVSQLWSQFSWLPQAGHHSYFLLSRNWRYFLIACKQDGEKGHVLVWCLNSKLGISSFNLPIVTWELIPSFVCSVLRFLQNDFILQSFLEHLPTRGTCLLELHAVERMLEAAPSFYVIPLLMHIYLSGKYHSQGRS